MHADSDYGGSESGGNGKLRSWLLEQVDSGKYPGLVWDNDDKSIFRIPWKHAGKQDYNRDEDAALFKAWALFKGKFREGIDKPDPPTWKTRLRCALNKSNDFEELVERSQLDISDPYKVYRVIPEGAKKRPRQGSPLSPVSYAMHSSYPSVQTQVPGYMPTPDVWRDYFPEQASLPELPFAQCAYPPRGLTWQTASVENGYQFKGTFSYSYSTPDTQPSPYMLDNSIRTDTLSDYRLHVSVYFRDSLIREVTTSSTEGCQIAPCPAEDKPQLSPGGPELIALPVESLSSVQRTAEDCSPSPPSAHDRGVRLWMAQDGLYALRQCPERVYWQGGMSPYGDKPSMLERDLPCRLLHTQGYLSEIQGYGLHGRPLPRFQALLSFGEEFMDHQRQRGTLAIQVEPMFARQLLYYTPQSGSHYYRSSYEHPGVTDHIMGPSEDYQRVITHHHHSSNLQE